MSSTVWTITISVQPIWQPPSILCGQKNGNTEHCYPGLIGRHQWPISLMVLAEGEQTCIQIQNIMESPSRRVEAVSACGAAMS